MSLEAGTYVQDLNSSNPPGTDLRRQGDDHLRLIKAVLKATLPGGSRALYHDMAAVTVASAATCDVLGAASDKVTVSGDTTITSLGTGTNRVKWVYFSGSPLLTYNGTSLITPTGADMQMHAGDVIGIMSDGSSNVRVLEVLRKETVLSPAQITASQNDYSPTGIATARVLRLDLDAAWTITGLCPRDSGDRIIINNISSSVLTLSDADASSTAAYRFSFGLDVALQAGDSIELFYDGTTSRWKSLSPPDKTTRSAVNTSTGSSLVEFTGIPFWARVVVLSLYNFSLSGADNFLIRAGGAGGYKTTGYTAGASDVGTSAGVAYNNNTQTTYIPIVGGATGIEYSGNIMFINTTANQWIASGVFHNRVSYNFVTMVAAAFDLGEALTKIEVGASGSNTIDVNTGSAITYW